MRKDRHNLSAYIKALRGNIPQIQFAKKLGIAQSSLNRMENKEQNVTIDMFEHLFIKLKVSISDILERTIK